MLLFEVWLAMRGLIGDFEASMFSDWSSARRFVLRERPNFEVGRHSDLSDDRRSRRFSVAIRWSLAFFRRSWCWFTASAVVLLMSIIVGYLFLV